MTDIQTSLNNCKLFIGQIPREMDEDTLIPFFAEFGAIVELVVIRDRTTRIHKGCAFVTYLDAASSMRAIEQLHDKVKLGNSLNPLQVRIADCQVERENKLFIGMLSKTFVEEDLINVFGKYGELREVHVIRDQDGSSKGCAFVKFVERDAASAAIEEINGSIPDGCTRPLVIKFADVKRHGKKIDEDDIDLYGAKSMPSMGHMQSHQPSHVVPQFYVSYPFATNHNTLPAYSHPSAYEIPNVNESHLRGPFTSEIYSHNQQVLNNTGGFNTNEYKSRFASEEGGRRIQTSLDDAETRPPEGPTGCNLFIYHLPRDLTDADLATLFAPFGNVISAKVFVDKKTSDSKGFGFVSFDSVESANASIISMNGFQIGNKRLKVQHKKVVEDPPMAINQYQHAQNINPQALNRLINQSIQLRPIINVSAPLQFNQYQLPSSNYMTTSHHF